MRIVLEQRPPGQTPTVEIVERKGLGHPDTICDALAEQVGRALWRTYEARFGRPLHYNVDKILLVGGESSPAFGGGEVLEPISLILAGRVTRRVGEVELPTDEIATEACRAWLRERLPSLDPDRNVRIECRFRAGSADLSALFGRGAVPLANDSSVGVGFAPLTPLERAVLAVERALTAPEARTLRPWAGPDVKVMGVREGPAVRLTVATAFIGRHLADLEDYLRRRSELAAFVRAVAAGVLGAEPEVRVNAADDPASGSIYLTVTGTSAEAGDDGEVGRGNRCNGLITPLRPMSMEATAGKNIATHTGRLYNTLASLVAADLVERLPGVHGATVALVSEIGRPVTQPALASLRISASDPVDAREAEALLAARLGSLKEVRERLLSGELGSF